MKNPNIYAIGDIQGCYNSLQRLLDKINFDDKTDQLWFAGDIVNRGLHSLATLRFIKSLRQSAITVLGNHDLFLIAAYYQFKIPRPCDTIHDILKAPDAEELIQWLAQQPLLYAQDNHVLVHAGIPPQWSLNEALQYANEVSHALINDTSNYLQHLYGNEPLSWNNTLSSYNRLRYITNAFTRMRYCDAQGHLDFSFKDHPNNYQGSAQPWYAIENRKTQHQKIFFGHWAALEGKIDNKHQHIFALDTGCAWGDRLTAIRLKDEVLFSVPAEKSDLPN